MKLRVLFLAAFVTASALAGVKPNVIFILTDDLGYGDVGFAFQQKRPTGEIRISTPNIDRLAAEGVELTDHYCAAPVCAPSRASILTGKLQGHCSVIDNQFDRPINEQETLATVMKRAGYRTFAVGKWGIGGGGESGVPESAHPLDRGFDHYYGFLHHLAGHTYYHYDGSLNGAYMGVFEDRKNATDTAIGRYSTDLFTAKAKEYISRTVKENPKAPFFMYLAVNTIHGSGRCDDTLKCKETLHVPGGPYPKAGVQWPLQPEPLEKRNTWIDPQYRKLGKYPSRYATAITRFDDALADLMNHLKKVGVYDNTVIIFTSDNGPAAEYGADPKFFQSAGPFRGMKRDVLEGGERVPTFVWRKGGFGVKKDSTPSISVDWLPTLAELAGVETENKTDGVSLLPRWQKPSVAKNEKAEKPRGSQVETTYFFRRRQLMQRVGDYSAVKIGEDSPWAVYNLSRDVRQEKNLAEIKPKCDYPWCAAFNDEVRQEWILPDQVIGENADPWRPVFNDIFPAVVRGAKTTTEAVQRINAVIWEKLGVRYSIKRDQARQSVFHSMRTGLASCTGMAILQVDAYRSVGIPARLVGCNWTKLPGNHSWVEFMDENGEWHFFGDGDPSPIDDSWIAPFAAEADDTRAETRIYASRSTPNAQKLRFWRTWSEEQGESEVWADDVTQNYRRFAKAGVGRKDVPTDTNYTLTPETTQDK